jgi:hypothetical protein
LRGPEGRGTRLIHSPRAILQPMLGVSPTQEASRRFRSRAVTRHGSNAPSGMSGRARCHPVTSSTTTMSIFSWG